MTHLPVVRSARAEDDLFDMWLYIAEHSEAAADRLLGRIEARWRLLETQPYSGASREDISPGLRHVVTGDYLSLYRVAEDRITIVRVLHGRRNITAEDVEM